MAAETMAVTHSDYTAKEMMERAPRPLSGPETAFSWRLKIILAWFLARFKIVARRESLDSSWRQLQRVLSSRKYMATAFQE